MKCSPKIKQFLPQRSKLTTSDGRPGGFCWASVRPAGGGEHVVIVSVTALWLDGTICRPCCHALALGLQCWCEEATWKARPSTCRPPDQAGWAAALNQGSPRVRVAVLQTHWRQRITFCDSTCGAAARVAASHALTAGGGTVLPRDTGPRVRAAGAHTALLAHAPRGRRARSSQGAGAGPWAPFPLWVVRPGRGLGTPRGRDQVALFSVQI